MSDQPADVVLSCGCYLTCRVNDGDRIFQVSPCKASCDNIGLVTEMALEMSMPVEFKEGSDEPH